jgi:hypothetical protein
MKLKDIILALWVTIDPLLGFRKYYELQDENERLTAIIDAILKRRK